MVGKRRQPAGIRCRVLTGPRILVVGGRGFLGRRTVSALRRLPGVEVGVGSRRAREGGVEIDILDSSSRPSMSGYDIVVNCSDSVAVPPDRAAEYCLRSGIVFVETSAHAGVVETLRESALEVDEPSGSVVLCAGLFPGLSNLLAAELRGAAEGGRAEVGVRYSPLSQGGPGVCSLMLDLLARPARRFQDGARVEHPSVSIGGRFPFSRGERAVLRVGLPESLMLHWSGGASTTDAYLAPVPGVPVSVLRLAVLLSPWEVVRWGPLRWFAGGALRLLRTGALRWLGSPVELAARVAPAGGEPARCGSLRVSHGFDATACAVAATVGALLDQPPDPGVHLIDQVTGLHDVVGRMRELGGVTLHLELGPDG